MTVSNIDVGSRVRFVKAGSFGRVAFNFYDIGHIWYMIRRVPKGKRPFHACYWVRDDELEEV